jgi:N-acylneuraminate cytidylyltransferase
MSQLEILGIIPARGGSKGVTRKNVRPLCGHPLLCYTIAAAQGSRLLTRVVVSTEDAEIADVAAQAGCEVVDRPAEMARDDSPTLPAAQHAVLAVEAQIGRKLDHVVILQATTPFRSSADIDACLEKLISTGADCVVSVRQAHEVHASKLKKLEGDGLLPYLMEEVEGVRRQDLPPCYVRNGGIYATRRGVLMEQGSIYGSDTRACVMPDERSLDINTEVDFLLAETLLNHGLVQRLP